MIFFFVLAAFLGGQPSYADPTDDDAPEITERGVEDVELPPASDEDGVNPTALTPEGTVFRDTNPGPTEASTPSALDIELPVASPETTAHAADQFIANQGEIIAQIFQMHRSLQVHLAEQQRLLGDKQFRKDVLAGKKDHLRVHDETIGWAEPTTIDEIMITRVVHSGTGIAFLIIDERVNTTSDHFRQYVARLHQESNRTGRHVMIIKTNANGHSLEYSPMPRMNTAQWWREFYDAVTVRPTAGHIKVAMLSAGAQVAVALSVSKLQVLLSANPHGSIDLRPAILSGIFGTVMGIFVGTWKNYAGRGSNFEITIKNSAISTAFAYILHAWTHHGLASLSIMDATGLLANASLITNVYVNNYTKTFWSELSRIRENMGANRGTIWGLPRTALEYQLIYLAPFTLKILDLVQFNVHVPLLGTLPLGKLVFLSSAFWVQKLVVNYAVRNKYERAAERQREWEDFISGRALLNSMREYVSLTRSAINRAGQTLSTVKQSCSEFLTGIQGPRIGE